MDGSFGYCGLDCGVCPVFLATKNNDDGLKLKTAAEWSRQYGEYIGKELSVEDMVCSGCKSDKGTLFTGCVSCMIRQCCKGKKFETCGKCTRFNSCDMIQGFLGMHPTARENLKEYNE